MEFQLAFTEHILSNATAVMSEATAESHNSKMEEIKNIFHGKLETIPSSVLANFSEQTINDSPLLSPHFRSTSNDDTDTKSLPYVVFIILSDEDPTIASSNRRFRASTLCQYSWCIGYTLVLDRPNLSESKNYVETPTAINRAWLISQLRSETVKHFSWEDLMKDELMEDPEYKAEIFDAVVEELDMIEDIELPATYNLYTDQYQANQKKHLQYVTKIWKLSHSYKTTARLVGGTQLGTQSSTICELLRPVVRSGVNIDTMNDQGESMYNLFRNFVSSTAILGLVIRKLIDMGEE